MKQLKVKWIYDRDPVDNALYARYKKHLLRMTWEGGLYVGWIDGVRRVSAKTKGELYRKYADEPEMKS